MSDFCVRCGDDLRNARCTGEPGIYRSDPEWTLCEPCFFAEDYQIETEGGNDLPDVREAYRKNYELRG